MPTSSQRPECGVVWPADRLIPISACACGSAGRIRQDGDIDTLLCERTSTPLYVNYRR